MNFLQGLWVALCLLVFSNEVGADGSSSLLKRWTIAEPVADPEGDVLTINYFVDRYIQQNFVKFSVYQGTECSEGGEENEISNERYMRVDISGSEGESANRISVRVKVNGSKLDSDAAIQTVNGEDVEINYCAKFAIYDMDVDDAEAVEVNFMESLVTLTVDPKKYEIQSYEILMKGSEEEQNLEESGFGVDTYECDEDNMKYSASIPKFQGDMIRICISPNQESYQFGARMHSIGDFVFSNGKFNQSAIESGSVHPSHGLTEVECEEGAGVCVFETILLSEFFDEDGTVSASGEVKLMHYGHRPFPVTKGNTQIEQSVEVEEENAPAEVEVEAEAEAEIPEGGGGGGRQLRVVKTDASNSGRRLHGSGIFHVKAEYSFPVVNRAIPRPKVPFEPPVEEEHPEHATQTLVVYEQANNEYEQQYGENMNSATHNEKTGGLMHQMSKAINGASDDDTYDDNKIHITDNIEVDRDMAVKVLAIAIGVLVTCCALCCTCICCYCCCCRKSKTSIKDEERESFLYDEDGYRDDV